MSLTFYYSPQSSATPVHWALEELGVPYEKVKIDLKANQQKEPAFLKLNPNGRVPLLVHDGVPIFESAAIQIYLGETFGVDRGLFPPPGPRRGEAMGWIVWNNVTLGEALSRFGHNLGQWAPEDERNAKAGAKARGHVEDALRILEGALQGKEYLVGDRFSLVDVHLSSWMSYLGMMGFDLSRYPTIKGWVARCEDRPACKRAD